MPKILRIKCVDCGKERDWTRYESTSIPPERCKTCSDKQIKAEMSMSFNPELRGGFVPRMGTRYDRFEK